MKNRWIILVCCMCSIAGSVVRGDPVSLTRYALVIGSNTGNDDRVELKYAISDALSFAKVMTDLGGVSTERCLLVKNPDRGALLLGLDRLKKMIGSEKTVEGRKEVVVYYSGHADENGIILGKDGFSYKDIRDNLHDIGVDVRIAVLDACASGSLTREKGGTHRRPFLFDVSTAMEGYAFLTSSSSDEASQESDAIQSSFFTHYLVSGLRGPADANGDGKVTLNEAYEFAYDETLQRTEKTKAGPQHAAYDIRLKGSGDLVLTDLRTSGAVLRLAPSVNGRVFIHNEQGQLLVELYKTAGKMLEIGLEPGTFEVLVHTPETVSAGKVTLKEGAVTLVTQSTLSGVKPLRNRLRGTTPADGDTYAHVPVNLSLLPQLSLNGMHVKTITNAAISLLAGKTDKLHGMELSSGVSWVTEGTIGGQIAAVACMSSAVSGLQIAGAANLVKGDYTGLQIASAANLDGGSMHGLQISGAVNLAGDDFIGLQIAAAVNHTQGKADAFQISGAYNYAAEGVRGLQLSGALNITGDGAAGLQMASAVNHTLGNVKALQIAGAYNYAAGEMFGLQLSGGANIAMKQLTGVQIAGALNTVLSDCKGLRVAGAQNLAKTMTGFQVAGGMNSTRKTVGCEIAGGLNINKRFVGFQLAPINLCKKMTGFQLGVVNVCDTVEGVSMAVFSFVRKTPPRYRVYFDEAGFAFAGVRSGGDYFYSLLSLGTSTVADRYQWCFGAGFGARMPLKHGYVAAEAMAHQIHQEKVWDALPIFHVRNSIIYGHQFTNRFCVWAGPSLNVAIAWKDGKERNSYRQVTYEKHLHHWHAYWPGITAGIEL